MTTAGGEIDPACLRVAGGHDPFSNVAGTAVFRFGMTEGAFQLITSGSDRMAEAEIQTMAAGTNVVAAVTLLASGLGMALVAATALRLSGKAVAGQPIAPVGGRNRPLRIGVTHPAIGVEISGGMTSPAIEFGRDLRLLRRRIAVADSALQVLAEMGAVGKNLSPVNPILTITRVVGRGVAHGAVVLLVDVVAVRANIHVGEEALGDGLRRFGALVARQTFQALIEVDVVRKYDLVDGRSLPQSRTKASPKDHQGKNHHENIPVRLHFNHPP